MIQLLLHLKLKSSASFRCVRQVMLILNLYVEGLGQIPSSSSIIRWVKKVGYYELIRPKVRARDWIILLDHSIELGQQKVLVVLGIRESEVDFNRPLSYNDLRALHVEGRSKWQASDIQKSLKSIKLAIGESAYAVGDHESVLRQGVSAAGIAQVHDLTHAIALMLKSLYHQDEQFLRLCREIGHLRSSLCQSIVAALIPPAQRKKSRYLNLGRVAQWSKNALDLLDNPHRIQHKEMLPYLKRFDFLNMQRTFIEQLSQIDEVVRQIEQILKQRGMNQLTISASETLLSTLKGSYGQTLSQKMKQYFKQYSPLIKQRGNLICTSDILESCFGKFKYYTAQNPMIGLTDLVLCIPAFTTSLDQQTILRAMEKVSCDELKQWKNKHIKESLINTRRTLFKNNKASTEQQKLDLFIEQLAAKPGHFPKHAIVA